MQKTGRFNAVGEGVGTNHCSGGDRDIPIGRERQGRWRGGDGRNGDVGRGCCDAGGYVIREDVHRGATEG